MKQSTCEQYGYFIRPLNIQLVPSLARLKMPIDNSSTIQTLADLPNCKNAFNEKSLKMRLFFSLKVDISSKMSELDIFLTISSLSKDFLTFSAALISLYCQDLNIFRTIFLPIFKFIFRSILGPSRIRYQISALKLNIELHFLALLHLCVFCFHFTFLYIPFSIQFLSISCTYLSIFDLVLKQIFKSNRTNL